MIDTINAKINQAINPIKGLTNERHWSNATIFGSYLYNFFSIFVDLDDFCNSDDFRSDDVSVGVYFRLDRFFDISVGVYTDTYISIKDLCFFSDSNSLVNSVSLSVFFLS